MKNTLSPTRATAMSFFPQYCRRIEELRSTKLSFTRDFAKIHSVEVFFATNPKRRGPGSSCPRRIRLERGFLFLFPRLTRSSHNTTKLHQNTRKEFFEKIDLDPDDSLRPLPASLSIKRRTDS
jgi:hypothetical protein